LDEEAFASIGQRNAPRCAMQKARAEPFLQCLHVLAGGGLGNAKFTRRAGETP
jgi:hypothetical protein